MTYLLIEIYGANNLVAMRTRKTPDVIMVKMPCRTRYQWNQIQTLLTAGKKERKKKKRSAILRTSTIERGTRAGESLAKKGYHIHLISGRHIRALATDAQLSNVLASQLLTHVAKLRGLWSFAGLVWVCCRMYGEVLVVAEGVDGAIGKEAGMMYGAVVDDLHQGLVLVCYRCIINVYESVRAAGQ